MPTVDLVADYGAPTDGVTSSSTALSNFRTAMAGQTGLVTLTAPAHVYILDADDGGSPFSFVKGMKKLLVYAPGATFRSTAASVIFSYGGGKEYPDALHSARTATVSAGATSVTLLIPSQASRFSVGSWARMSGFDLQGSWHPAGLGAAYPTNHHFFEFVQITGSDATSGVVSFSTSLKNSYKATWPLYDPGVAVTDGGVDCGGPATLYALPSDWDFEIEWRGDTGNVLTLDQPNAPIGIPCGGRQVVFTDVVEDTSKLMSPSLAKLWRATRCSIGLTNGGTMEVDKSVEQMDLDASSVKWIDFQSSSVGTLNMTNGSTITTRLQGTPQNTNISSDCVIADFRPGTIAYGASTGTLRVGTATLTSFAAGGRLETAAGLGVNNHSAFSMSGGVIRIANTYGAAGWNVPGAWLMWSGSRDNEKTFQVLDVTQDATYTYVSTTWPGGFPSVPLDTGKLYIRVHPASRVFGSSLVEVDNHPLFDHQTQTWNGNTLGTTAHFWTYAWGRAKRISFNVTQASATALTFLLSQNNNWPVLKNDNSEVNYAPVIDMTVAGERVVDENGNVSGGGGSDSGLGFTGGMWFQGGSNSGSAFSANVSGASPLPSITIIIETDQGLVETATRNYGLMGQACM